ncbi:hypothetical protein [Paeniglutamicibacter cryotolerans]
MENLDFSRAEEFAAFTDELLSSARELDTDRRAPILETEGIGGAWIVIVYQEAGQVAATGQVLELNRLAAAFDPDPSPAELARIVVQDMILDPSGAGRRCDEPILESFNERYPGLGWYGDMDELPTDPHERQAG